MSKFTKFILRYLGWQRKYPPYKCSDRCNTWLTFAFLSLADIAPPLRIRFIVMNGFADIYNATYNMIYVINYNILFIRLSTHNIHKGR